MQLQNAVERRTSATRMCKDDGSFWRIFHLVTLTTNKAKLVRVLAGISGNVPAGCEPTERSEGGLPEADGANATGAQADLLCV